MRAYASGDCEDEDLDITNFDYVAADRKFDLTERSVFLGESKHGRFLGPDQVWDGGGDLKYFWSR